MEKAKQELEHRASESASDRIEDANELPIPIGPETSVEVSRFGQLKDEIKDELAASGRLSRLLSVRAKRHSLAPQLSAVKE